uniref:RRM domain-containing protein n=1 Tax=Amphimedon queenslandica TaxID=400682 RepID=A0A1X7TFE4_AMPQE
MLEKYGAFIVARGCAYVVMETREAAAKVVDQLRDPKVLGQKCKVAWAPGRGAKGKEFDPSWDVNTGISNISWDNVKTKSQVEALGNGGVVDTRSSTLPPQLREEEIAEVEMES